MVVVGGAKTRRSRQRSLRGAAWWIRWDERDSKAQMQRAAATIRALLHHRGDGKTICPSDVARASAGERFRAAMPLVRTVIHELAAAGDIDVLQKGKRVNPERARGPIRIALKPSH